jgi:hypothetical protein
MMSDLLNKIIKWQTEIAPQVPYLETPTGYFLQFELKDNGGYTCPRNCAILWQKSMAISIQNMMKSSPGIRRTCIVP